MKFILITILFTFTNFCFACDKPNLSVNDAFNEADIVFSGKITNLRYLDDIEQEKTEPRIIVTFETDKFWKGSNEKQIILHTTHNKGSCNGFVFNAGERYLVYAVTQKRADNFFAKLFVKKEPTIGVKIFGGTKLLSEAKKDIEVLRKIKI